MKMAARRSRKFLYLAIACFLGLVAVFVFAGYLGVYDTVYIQSGEYEQVAGPEVWKTGNSRYPYSTGATWGDPVGFRYEINNRWFSSYTAPVDVSLWRSNEKVLQLLHQDVSIPAFKSTELQWTLTPQALQGAGLGVGQYTVKITRGGQELGQGIIIGFNTAYPPKTIIPAPARVG